MSSKRRKAGQPKKSNRSAEKDAIAATPFLAERALVEISRALEGKHFKSAKEADAYLNELLGDGSAQEAGAPRSAFQEAQDLMYLAWDTADPDERIRIAETALQISGDCADAFTLLGDEKAMSSAEARAYYEEAVRAGTRAIGERAFEESVGHFWGLLETRPYMRARARLAAALWDIGDRKSAIEHIQDLLRLNPADNQGNRYVLLSMLLENGDDTAVKHLLAAYPDDGAAEWLYDKALWLINRRAPSDEISIALDDAIATNPFVPAYLLGRKKLPREMPNFITYGSDVEAGGYAKEAKGRWVASAGALEHLMTAVARGKKSRKLHSR